MPRDVAWLVVVLELTFLVVGPWDLVDDEHGWRHSSRLNHSQLLVIGVHSELVEFVHRLHCRAGLAFLAASWLNLFCADLPPSLSGRAQHSLCRGHGCGSFCTLPRSKGRLEYRLFLLWGLKFLLFFCHPYLFSSDLNWTLIYFCLLSLWFALNPHLPLKVEQKRAFSFYRWVLCSWLSCLVADHYYCVVCCKDNLPLYPRSIDIFFTRNMRVFLLVIFLRSLQNSQKSGL